MDEAHRIKVDKVVLALGHFVIEFESMCEGMRSTITGILKSYGLGWPDFSEVIVGENKPPGDLQILLGALFSEMCTYHKGSGSKVGQVSYDKEDRKAMQIFLIVMLLY